MELTARGAHRLLWAPKSGDDIILQIVDIRNCGDKNHNSNTSEQLYRVSLSDGEFCTSVLLPSSLFEKLTVSAHECYKNHPDSLWYHWIRLKNWERVQVGANSFLTKLGVDCELLVHENDRKVSGPEYDPALRKLYSPIITSGETKLKTIDSFATSNATTPITNGPTNFTTSNATQQVLQQSGKIQNQNMNPYQQQAIGTAPNQLTKI